MIEASADDIRKALMTPAVMKINERANEIWKEIVSEKKYAPVYDSWTIT